MQILTYILYLAALACSILILIHAFKASVGQGFLCLCIPLYILYYAFARFEHEKKNLILGVWLGAFVLSMFLGGASAFTAFQQSMP